MYSGVTRKKIAAIAFSASCMSLARQVKREQYRQHMDEALTKPCIFITSLGRTGTTFFGTRLMQVIEDCTSREEPDYISGYETLQEMYTKTRDFGLFRVTAGRFFTRYSMRALGVARQKGKVSDAEAVKYIRQARKNVLNNLKTKIYLEANLQLCALTDLLPLAFPNSKVAYIVRDPRSWVSSWMNFGRAIYSSYDVRCLLNSRLTPHHIAEDPYRERWKSMSRFEKLCWSWGRENSYALKCAENSASASVFRFEDLFCAENNYDEMARLLAFVSEFPDGSRAKWSFDREFLRNKVNTSGRDIFPEWSAWESKQAELLDEHCGELMTQLGYGCEEQWQELLGPVDLESRPARGEIG